MTIASEIQRLQTAKANIKAAIEGKNVSVPSTAKLSDMATYINQIDAWRIPWIIWSSPMRTQVKTVWSNQERYHMLWYASYSIWDYLFIVACYSWLTSNNYDQYVISVFRRKKWTSDYDETSTGISNSWLEDHSCQWIKITTSWNTITFETCTKRPTAWNNEYYWHHTQTYSTSNDTWWSWAEESYYGTWWNPYFSGDTWDQNLYSVGMEPTRGSATVLKFTPNFS